jgi:palmitoyltransferase ZDHHC9/14/18
MSSAALIPPEERHRVSVAGSFGDYDTNANGGGGGAESSQRRPGVVPGLGETSPVIGRGARAISMRPKGASVKYGDGDTATIDPSLLMASSPRIDVWPGRNVFCCGGYFMLGSGGHYLPLTLALIIAPSVLFVLFVLGVPANQLSDSNAPLDGASVNSLEQALGRFIMDIMYGLTGALLFLTVSTLLLAAMTEPGIVLRQPRWKQAAVPSDVPLGLQAKYCGTCNIFRPLRAKHCSFCNNCVLVFDHHCPWTGNCVGLRNYHYFLWFVSSVNVLSAYVTVMCVARFFLDLQANARSFSKAVNACPWAMGVGSFTLLVLLTTLPLLWYHLCTQMARGETTNENLRHTYDQLDNPYHLGCGGNLSRACGAPAQPSQVVGWKELLREEFMFIESMVRRRGGGSYYHSSYDN